MTLNISKSGGVDKIYFLQVAHFQHSIIEVLQFSEQLGKVCPAELQKGDESMNLMLLVLLIS